MKIGKVASPKRADVAIIGAGSAGAALALVLARLGVAVTLVERQTRHRDRVLGEAMMPWGVREAQALIGVGDILRRHGAIVDKVFQFDEDLAADAAIAAPQHLGVLFEEAPGIVGISNPRFTSELCAAAAAAGADVLMSASFLSLSEEGVVIEHAGRQQEVAAGIVVGADGRKSKVRTAIGATLHVSGPRSLCTGMAVEDMLEDVPQDAVTAAIEGDQTSVVFPQGAGRARLYHMYGLGYRDRYRGRQGAIEFLDAFDIRCVPWSGGVAQARQAGPCATFPIFDTWADRVWRDRVVLIGDAAGSSNPLCGQGLSLCMRDVRLVADAILGHDRDFVTSLTDYSEDRAMRMFRLRTTSRFFSAYSIPIGPESRSHRQQVRELASRDPDVAALFSPLHLGPYAAPEISYDPAWVDEVLSRTMGALRPDEGEGA